MRDLAKKIENKIQQDPGERGLHAWAVQDQLLPALLSLNGGNHILLASGFYILKAGAIETDGPPGSLILADALTKAGKRVTLLTDEHSREIFTAGLNHVDPRVELVTLKEGEIPDSGKLIRQDTTHIIALERPGMAQDGKYYNFAGRDISGFHASLDSLFTDSRKHGLITLGIGDGGNELGMGLISDPVDKHTGKPFGCRTNADYCICAGVSNWGGYGMAALLSCLNGKNLMEEASVMKAIVRDIVAAGAVDGISGRQECTVDGLDFSWEESIYDFMYELACEATSGLWMADGVIAGGPAFPRVNGSL